MSRSMERCMGAPSRNKEEGTGGFLMLPQREVGCKGFCDGPRAGVKGGDARGGGRAHGAGAGVDKAAPRVAGRVR